MGWVVLFVLVFFVGYYHVKKGKQVIKKSGNYIWIEENNSKKDVGKFERGVIYAVPSHSSTKPWVIGHYDEEGNVYNSDRALIGSVNTDGRMTLSKEYQYEEAKKMLPNVKLTKKDAELQRRIGEALGGDSGTIFEKNDYDNAKAFYETDGKADIVEPMVGAGAAYIALIYEMILQSDSRSFYSLDASQWIEKH